MQLHLDRTSAVPLNEQIANGIRAQIEAGVLPEGSRLKSSRDLADELDVNRATVVQSYGELKREGYLESGVGKGTFVLQPRHPNGRVVDSSEEPIDWTGRLALPHLALAPNPGASEADGMIPLSRAVVHPSLFPFGEIRERLQEALAQSGPGIFEYCSPAGHRPLREALRTRLARRGIDFERNELLIVNGSQQGLDLVARLLLDQRSEVFTSRPAFSGALDVFRLSGATTRGVDMDAEGMRPDALASMLGTYRPTLLYTIPSFHNPTGASMGEERRRTILALARQHSVPILEDDWLADLEPDDGPTRLKAMDDTGSVLYLGTASKVLVPGFRLGWLVVPRTLFPAFVGLKKSADLACNLPGQVVLAQMLEDGSYDRHVARLREELRQRRDLVARAIEEHFPAFARPLADHHGMVLWIRLPAELNVGSIVEAAHQRGIELTAGKPFDPHGEDLPGFRISYGTAEKEALEPTLRTLGAVLQEAWNRSSRTHGLPLV